MCTIYSPRWIIVTILWYLLYMATFKLLSALAPNWYLQLNHELIEQALHCFQIVANLVDVTSLLLGKIRKCKYFHKGVQIFLT